MAKMNTTVAARLVAQALGPGAKFVVVKLEKGQALPVYDGDGQLLKFSSGKEAANAASQLSADTGIKHQPRPINDQKWREREEAKLKAKDYLPLPWAAEQWWLDLKPVWGDHYPHASVDKEAFLAYTENAEKGAADIQTRIKPGRYLEQYFGTTGILNQYVIRDLCSKFSNIYEANIVHIATTPEEIEEVYTTGPSSCMSKAKGSYPTPIHPVAVYGAGDLALAYIKRDGRPTARTVIWPDKKIYTSYFYGDAARLRPLLQKMGYKEGSLDGARLLKRSFNLNKSMKGTLAFVAPHVDGYQAVSVDGDVLRIGKDKRGVSFACGGGAGHTELLAECPGCESQLAPVTRMMNVIKSDNGTGEVTFVCSTCTRRIAFQCPITGSWVHKDHGIEAYTSKGKTQIVWKRCIRDGYVVQAKDDGAYYMSSLVVKVGKDSYSPGYAEKNLTRCKCGKYLSSAQDCSSACLRKWESAMSARAPAYATTFSSTSTSRW